VLVGFKTGLALYLATTQLPKMLGFAGSHGDFFERLAEAAPRGPADDALPVGLRRCGCFCLAEERLLIRGPPVLFSRED
jgi:MFS superfamily sulfate permease-like transporter